MNEVADLSAAIGGHLLAVGQDRGNNVPESFESVMAQADLILTEFADRERDQGGRYAAGSAGAGVDDYRAAHGGRKRKLLKRVAGAAALAGTAGLVGGTKMGRAQAGRLGQGLTRGVQRVATGF